MKKSILDKKQLPAKPILLLLDYDGTLTPLKPKPEQAKLSPAARRILREIKRNNPVVLVSGRNIPSLSKVSRLFDFPMIGTHGFECRGLNHFELATSIQKRQASKEMSLFYSVLRRNFAAPFWIEQKPYSTALHYGKAALSTRGKKRLTRFFRRLLFKTVLRGRWEIQEGEKLLEAKPRGFSKGLAVQALISFYDGFFPVYAGDDLTDLHALKRLKGKGLRIGVGSKIKPRQCDLWFESPSAFIQWLRKNFG